MMDNSNSGFIDPESFRIDRDFSSVTEIPSNGYNALAKAQRFGRWMMLKGLKEELRTSEIYKILLQKEFNLLVDLQHPNIVSVIDFVEESPIGECILMEWIDGTTLKEWLTQPHSNREKQRVIDQLLNALEYVHGKQIVHRDLKPSNIMITRSGQNVKLIDFGLSDTDDYAILKQPAGTKNYLSPEQKKKWQTDVRNDIYSVGCVLRDMQIGKIYDPIIERCVGEETKRYSNIDELRKALERKRRLPHLFTTVALLALLAVLAFLFFYNQHGNMQRMQQQTDSIGQQLTNIKEYQTLRLGSRMGSNGRLVFNGLEYDVRNKTNAAVDMQPATDLPQVLIIPEQVTNGNRAIPVTKIYWHAFWNCERTVQVIVLPKTITHIADGAFDGGFGYQLDRFEVDSLNTAFCAVDGVLYTKDMRELVKYPSDKGGTSYRLPESVSIIRAGAFDYAHNLERIYLNDSLKIIGNYAFSNCKNLAILTLPKSLRSVGEESFVNCIKLPSVFIANPMKYVGISTIDID